MWPRLSNSFLMKYRGFRNYFNLLYVELLAIFLSILIHKNPTVAASQIAVEIEILLFWQKPNSNRFQKSNNNDTKKGEATTKELHIKSQHSWEIFCYKRHTNILNAVHICVSFDYYDLKSFLKHWAFIEDKSLNTKSFYLWKPWIWFHLRWNCFTPRKNSRHHTKRTLEVHWLLKQLPELALLFWVHTQII